MDDPTTIDELLAEITDISRRLDDDPSPADRKRLEQRRTHLRTLARRADDAARSDAVLLNELGTLQRRRNQIDERPIAKGWTEKADIRWFNDPGAYSSQINRMIDGQDEDERASIVARISEIEAVLASRSADR